MEVHPACNLFPLIDGAEFEELVDSIKTHGQQQPIVLTKAGQLLDGRNRHRACERLGKKPITTVYRGKLSPTAFVVAANVHRRHLTTSQRAEIGRELEVLFAAEADENVEKRPKKPGCKFAPKGGDRASRAAKAMNVSERTVKAAKAVHAAAPALSEKIRAGEMTVHAAMQQVKAKAEKPPVATDEEGQPIPDKLLAVFESREKFKAALNHIAKLKTLLADCAEGPGGAEMARQLQKAEMDRENIRRAVRFSMPHAVMPPKSAQRHAGEPLAERGWLTELQFKNLPGDEK